MAKKVNFSKRFSKEYDLMLRRGKDISKLKQIIILLENDEPLPFKHRDHKLTGDYVGSRELHIEPDWLLIYRNSAEELILERTGSHSDLFQK
jgi:mRNA interferase YafQ